MTSADTARRNDHFRRETILRTFAAWTHEAFNSTNPTRDAAAGPPINLAPEVAALDPAEKLAVLDLVRHADDFPTPFHESGVVHHKGVCYVWQIADADGEPILDPDGDDRILSIVRR